MSRDRDIDRYKVFGRRAFVLAGSKLALLTLLGARMYYLQVVEADRYATLAEDNRISLRLLPPPRGRIVDRAGRPLAVNDLNYRAVITVRTQAGAERTLDLLSELIALADGDRARVLREVTRGRGFVPVTARENLTWTEVSRIEVNAPDLPGVAIEVGRSRFYPDGEDVAHVLGYVAAVSESEMTDDPLLGLPDFEIGKNGVEKFHDLGLRGKAGASQVEVNAVGRVIRELGRREGESGQEVALTLDLELQQFTRQRLGEESASTVVVEAHSGDILAMCSTPSFDPNAFTQGLSAAEWEALSSNPLAPLINKCIGGQYAPGSVFKLVVALAGLEAGLITRKQTFYCSGKYEYGDSMFHCWKRYGHGTMRMEEALKQSCDVYFYELARGVGIDRIAAMARRLGLGSRLGIDLPGERAGLVPTKDWKLAKLGVHWQGGETLVTAIGQGFVLTTPLQLAVMVARIVNGGVAVVPRVTRRVGGLDMDAPASPRTFSPLGIGAASLEFLARAMDGVVNHPLGTAYGARIEEPDWAMGGKTGTSQVRRISTREREEGVRSNAELPWQARDHALFVGYAPAQAPQYAIAVVIEHGGGGAGVAAPVARDILRETLRRGPARDHPRRIAQGGSP
jgi:penicillin-binding protein 2